MLARTESVIAGQQSRQIAVTFVLCLLAAIPAVSPLLASVENEAERIAEVLGLTAGATIADVGAGDGDWSVALAQYVGSTGRVYATEVEEGKLEEIRAAATASGLDNITAVPGDQFTTGLPGDCCDAILLRLVYHHFTDPEAMRSDLRRALKPDGLLAVIDIVPQTHWRSLPDVPDRGGHGIPRTDLVKELTESGFEVIDRYDNWNGDPSRYCVVFRRIGD